MKSKNLLYKKGKNLNCLDLSILNGRENKCHYLRKRKQKTSASVADKVIDDETNKRNDSIGNFGIADNKALSNKEHLTLYRANDWVQTHLMDSAMKKNVK